MRNELRYVDMVYQKGSFSKAARALFMTQPALSIAIAKIEGEIGMPLFDRSQKPLRLTEAGRIYIEKIRQMELLEREMRNQLLDLTAVVAGTVRVGATSYIISCVLPGVLKRFHEQHPGVRLELAEAGAYELKEMLRDQRLDITFLSAPEKDAPFAVTPAFTDHLLLAAPRALVPAGCQTGCALSASDVCAGRHRLPDCPAADVSAFAHMPFVLLGAQYNLRARADAIFAEAGLTPVVVLEVAQLLTSYALARSGMGVTLVPDRAVKPEHGDMVFFRLDSPHAVRHMSAATHTASYRSRATLRFLELLAQEAAPFPEERDR